jgi:hypothetical protein
MCEVVLVDIGVFQRHIFHNIDNLRAFGNTTITVIVDPHLQPHFAHLTDDVTIVPTSELDSFDFDVLHRQSAGFWANTSKRLFYVYSYMMRHGKTDCIHVENDYMIYFDGSELCGGTKVLLTMDAPNRCIPGFIFIPSHESLASLLSNYNHETNDMVNMAMFYHANRDKCDALNIDPRAPGKLFDAAAIGQYVGGVDTIHTGGIIQPGFINETCVVDYSHFSFCWVRKPCGLHVPCVLVDGRPIQIHGLHIHSKALENFNGRCPVETRLIPFSTTSLCS